MSLISTFRLTRLSRSRTPLDDAQVRGRGLVAEVGGVPAEAVAEIRGMGEIGFVEQQNVFEFAPNGVVTLFPVTAQDDVAPEIGAPDGFRYSGR